MTARTSIFKFSPVFIKKSILSWFTALTLVVLGSFYTSIAYACDYLGSRTLINPYDCVENYGQDPWYGPCNGYFSSIDNKWHYSRTYCDQNYLQNEGWEGADCTGCGGGGPSCFLPGTQVATPQGDKNIETLKPGDAVFSFNELTGKKVINTVSDSLLRSVPQYYVITTESGRQVKTTAEHPFFTDGIVHEPSYNLFSNVLKFAKSELSHLF